jgi:hypothetical protein
MRKVLAPLVLAAALSSGCNRQNPPGGIRRAPLKPLVRPAVRVVPVSELRASVRDSYRLRPDGRFLLAFGEITRLAAGTPAPQGLPATATFSESSSPIFPITSRFSSRTRRRRIGKDRLCRPRKRAARS